MTGAFAGSSFATSPFGGVGGDTTPPVPPPPGSTEDFPTLTLRYSLTGPLEVPEWVTVQGCVRAVSVARGRSDEGSTWDPGTAEITLGNGERQFDPENATGPHYGYLTVNRRIRLEATYAELTYTLFDGFADRWEQVPGSQANNYAECALIATDVNKLLGRIRMEATDSLILNDTADGRLGQATLAGPYEFGEQNAATRARVILRSSTIPDGMWTVDPSATVLVADRPDVETPIGEYLERIAASIGGDLVVAADGTLCLWDRWRWSRVTSAGVSTATWSDTPSIDGLPYREIDLVASDERTVANIVQRGRDGGFSARKRDRTSIGLYGPAEDARDDLLTADKNEIVAQVEHLLARNVDPRARVSGMVIVPQRDAGALFPEVLGRELGDRFTLVRKVAGVGEPFVAELTIDRIEHTAGPKVWETTWAASLAETTDLFTLGDDVLDGSALVAY